MHQKEHLHCLLAQAIHCKNDILKHKAWHEGWRGAVLTCGLLLCLCQLGGGGGAGHAEQCLKVPQADGQQPKRMLVLSPLHELLRCLYAPSPHLLQDQHTINRMPHARLKQERLLITQWNKDHLLTAKVQCQNAAIAIVFVAQLFNDVVLLVALKARVLNYGALLAATLIQAIPLSPVYK